MHLEPWWKIYWLGMLEIFHLKILGTEDNDEQLLTIPYISIKLENFHLEISGKETNEEQL